MKNLATVPGQRLVFSKCRLLKRTAYQLSFRDETKTVYRHLMASENGLLVYTGKYLHGLGEGKTVAIKGTVKRIENFGGGTVRISRPIILDTVSVPLYESEAKSERE